MTTGTFGWTSRKARIAAAAALVPTMPILTAESRKLRAAELSARSRAGLAIGTIPPKVAVVWSAMQDGTAAAYPPAAWIALAVLGSCLGFLPYNFRLNRSAFIFLGDAGSTVIGFVLACIAVYGDWAEGQPIVSLVSPVLVFWILIFEASKAQAHRAMQVIQKNFDAIDANKDGSLSHDELMAWRRAQRTTAGEPVKP